MSYQTPDKFYQRLHQVRPRFKRNVENVLGHLAFSIAQIGQDSKAEFDLRFDREILNFPGNRDKTEKTIANWRTEISALFSMVLHEQGMAYCTPICEDLANTSNFKIFFQRFLATFQYPGGHLKDHENKKIIDSQIRFHPGVWLASFYNSEVHESETEPYITAEEFCHCVLNDLRITRDHENVSTTIMRIQSIRHDNLTLDSTGDVIRYALDILDYGVLAGILTKRDRKYFLSPLGRPYFKELEFRDIYFSSYDALTKKEQIKKVRPSWIRHVNQEGTSFVHSVSATIRRQRIPQEPTVDSPNVPNNRVMTNKEIGDLGEAIALVHEKSYLTRHEKHALAALVKKYADKLAVGYDIGSKEVDGSDKYIEVKTTLSEKEVTFNQFHMTTNEWVKAESFGDKYFIYRIQISKEKGKKLFVLQDPVGQYKSNLLQMIPRKGADVKFEESCGEVIELLETQ